MLPRNIICDDPRSARPRVTFIDFNISTVRRLTLARRKQPSEEERPISPIEDWWFDCPATIDDFGPAWLEWLLEDDKWRVDRVKWRLWLSPVIKAL